MQRVLTLNQALVRSFAARPGAASSDTARQPPAPAPAPAHGPAHTKHDCAQATSRELGARRGHGSPDEAAPDQADCDADGAADAACACACHFCTQSRHALLRQPLNLAVHVSWQALHVTDVHVAARCYPVGPWVLELFLGAFVGKQRRAPWQECPITETPPSSMRRAVDHCAVAVLASALAQRHAEQQPRRHCDGERPSPRSGVPCAPACRRSAAAPADQRHPQLGQGEAHIGHLEIAYLSMLHHAVVISKL